MPSQIQSQRDDMWSEYLVIVTFALLTLSNLASLILVGTYLTLLSVERHAHNGRPIVEFHLFFLTTLRASSANRGRETIGCH